MKPKNKDFKNEIKIKPTFFEKMAYPAKYLSIRYSVHQIFIYMIFLFLLIGIFIAIQNLYI